MKELIEKYKKDLKSIEQAIDEGYNEEDGFSVEPEFWDQWIGRRDLLETVIKDLERYEEQTNQDAKYNSCKE